jgi:hypothetical protein
MSFVPQTTIQSLGREAYGNLLANTRQLGLHPQTHDPFLVSQQDRYAGTYIIGGTGLGKSKLLQSLIHQDIFSNLATFVMDPHGDLTHDTIAALPPELPREWLNKIYLLDMEDEEYPFGLNVFASVNFRSSMAFAQSVERIMNIFAVLWPEVTSQAYLPRYLRAAIIALAFNSGTTLVDMYTFLTNDGFRHRMLQNVYDPSVRQFWQTQYGDLSAAQQYQRVEPLVGRLESLLMGRSLVRNIVGQRQTTINFRKAIENREVIFIKLPMKTVPQDARLVGTILLSEIHAALFSFANTAAHDRPGFSLYCDEFQNFATPLFPEFFTEGRKFGARVTVAHQYRSQLPLYLQAATMVARTKICFQVSPDDAREMAHLFMGGEAKVKIDPQPLSHLLKWGSDSPLVTDFLNWYFIPLLGQKQGNTVAITQSGFRFDHIPFWIRNIRPPETNPEVYDPTLKLNHLLRDVMQTGNPWLPIPPSVVYGFSNCGKGFYQPFLYSFFYGLNKRKLLTESINFPPYLVANGRWMRNPKTRKEQLLHFLYHLRGMMEYVAAHPIGEPINATSADKAHEIVQLPKRQAFVRCDNDIGRMYTADTLPPMDEDTALGNFVLIKLQTRQKYCAQVNVAMQPLSQSQQPPVSRWEEVR